MYVPITEVLLTWYKAMTNERRLQHHTLLNLPQTKLGGK